MTAIHHPTSLWAQERKQYRVLFGVTFLVILSITPLARLLPARFRPWPPVCPRRCSVIEEARAVTHRVLPFAFL